MPQIFSGKKTGNTDHLQKKKSRIICQQCTSKSSSRKSLLANWYFLKPYIDGKRCHMSKKKLEICSFLQFTRQKESFSKRFHPGIFHLEPHKKNPPLKFKEQSKRIGPTLVVFMSLELKASQNFFPVHISVSRFRDKLGILLASNYVSNVNAFIKVNFSRKLPFGGILNKSLIFVYN